MLIDKSLVLEARKKLGDNAALIIANDLGLEQWDEVHMKSLCPNPNHIEETPSFIWYPEGTFFKCFGCGQRLDIVDHYMSFYGESYVKAVKRLFEQTETKFNFNEIGAKKKAYKYPYREENKSRDIVENYLAQRKLSKETLDRFDVQEDSNGNIVFHYYNTHDVLMTVYYRPSRKLKKTDAFTYWSQKDADNAPVLYGMHLVDPSLPLVITEGQIDCLSVYESGYKNVVSVPHGSVDRTWIEENFDFLEQFDKIIIWADNDESGVTMRRDVISRLGSWRTLYVDLPLTLEKDGQETKVKDANEVLYYFGKEKVLEFIQNAQTAPIQNVVDLADVEDFDIESAQGLYTNIPEFDKLIYKFVFGNVVLITGRAGSGKTSIMNQIFVCEALNQNHSVFYFSGEMPKNILRSWIDLQLSGRENVRVVDSNIRKINPEIRKQVKEWYRGKIFLYDNEDDATIDSIMNRAENVVRRFGAKVVILDNLATIDLNANDMSVWTKQKELLLKIKSFAAKFNVLVVLALHPRKTQFSSDRVTGQDIAGSYDMFNLTQYAFSLRRYSPTEKQGEKDNKGNFKKGKEPIEFDQELENLKNRITGNLGIIQLYFDTASYRFYTNNQSLWKRFGWNKDTSPFPKIDPNHHLPEFMEGN